MDRSPGGPIAGASRSDDAQAAPRGWLRAGVWPALVGAAIITVTTALGVWLYQERLSQLERTTAIVAHQAGAHLQAWTEARFTAMRMLSLRWARSYAADPEAFRRDAGLLQERLPGLLALNWVDTDGVIRVVVPEAPNRAALGSNLNEHPAAQVRQALAEAARTGRPTRARTLELLQGGTGFAFYGPVTGPDGVLAGFVNSVVRADELIASSRLATELGPAFRIDLRDVDGTRVWSNAAGAPRPWRLAVELPVPMPGGPGLTLAVAPDPQTIAAAVSVTQLAGLLLVSYLVAALLSVLVYQRGRAQEKVWRSERKLRELVDLLPHPFYVKDRDGRFTFVNRALAAACGRPAAELLGGGIERLPGNRGKLEEYARADREVLISGRAMPMRQERHEDAAGRERLLEMVRVPFRDPVSGTMAMLGMGVDVTERFESEVFGARIASALEQAGEAIAVLDAGGRILYANPAFSEMVGFSGRNVLGLTVEAFAAADGSDAPLIEEIRASLSEGRIWKRRYGSVWADGLERVRDATVAPVRDDDGVVTGFIAVLRDVTREQQLEDDLRQSQKLEAVGQLAGGIAHDFNNLLTVILGYAAQLRELAGEDGAGSAAAREIERAAERAADLTGQLLTFSRRRQRSTAVAPLNQVVQGLNAMLSRLIGEDIEIVLELDEAVAEVSASTSELEQIVVNLCVNARDAMPEGGHLEVWTARRDALPEPGPGQPDLIPGAYAVLGVRDSGCGMSLEVQQRIFEPFFTTKDVGAGTGLGLSTIYGIAEQRGGGVHLESAPGRGTTISVWLPVSSAETAVATPDEPSAADARQPAGTVLVAEDEEGIRQLMIAALRRMGYRVLSARDGIEALQRCADAGGVDLLVSDVVMPRMGGPELRDHLLKRYPDLKVLFVTGYAPEQARSGAELCADGVLEKPFRTRDLLAAVSEVVRASPQRAFGWAEADSDAVAG